MNIRNKLTAAVLAAGLALGCAACGGTPAPAAENTVPETAAPAVTAPVESAEADGAFSPNGDVIFEKDGVKVTTAGRDTDPTSSLNEPIIWLDFENSGSKEAYLGVTGGSVNGVMATVLLGKLTQEDGEYTGADYETDIAVPANSTVRYALAYYNLDVPGVDLSTLAEIEFSFTTTEEAGEWHGYVSEPVVIKTGETAPELDLSALGTTVVDDEKLTVVLGEQDYDDFFGPEICLYAENKSDSWLGVSPETAEGDGKSSNYIMGSLAVAPGKKAACLMNFDGDLQNSNGIETLSMTFSVCEADSYDALDPGKGAALDPVSVTYPPQVWGEYDNGGLRLSVRPKYNGLVTVETPADDKDGVLFSVSETASLEAGDFEGAGWLFSIGKVSEDKLHALLCSDMSGVEPFAKDGEGNYYVNYRPTDVRYARATQEEMERDAGQWTMLCEWAAEEASRFADKNGLEHISYSNTVIDMYLARAAWQDGVNATLSTTEFGPIAVKGVDGTPYAEFLLHGFYEETDPVRTPDGEYVVLAFPDEDVRLDFFFVQDGFVRLVSGDSETLYQAMWWDGRISSAEAMQGWYYALAELTGVKPLDQSLVRFYGPWHEKIAGRGTVDVEWSVAPGKVNIHVRWPESAAVVDTWELVASLEDGKLIYSDGRFEAVEYGEDGDSWTVDGGWEESGFFYLNGAGELMWHNDRAEPGAEDSTFVKS